MQQLVIEYVFEGHQRGYNITSATNGLDQTTLKTIWRRAMPRGQGWGRYIGARALKCFPLDDGLVAVSEVTVTDQRDESDRAGIRRAVIDLMDRRDYLAYLDNRLLNLPPEVRVQVDRLPSFTQRAKIMNRALPGVNKNPQMILSYPYTNPHHWLVIEGLVLKLALSPIGPMRRWGRVIPFTTLALDYREESLLVVLPESKARTIKPPVLSL